MIDMPNLLQSTETE